MLDAKRETGHRNFEVLRGSRQYRKARSSASRKCSREVQSLTGRGQYEMGGLAHLLHTEPSALTLIHDAATIGAADIVVALIKYGADPAPDMKTGDTALHRAMEHGQGAWRGRC